MVGPQVLNNVKAATVALGLVKKGSSDPFAVYGGGFLVYSGNYVMTAGHVSGAIQDMMNFHKKNNLEVDRAIFMLHMRSDRFDFDTAIVEEKEVARFRYLQKPAGFTMCNVIDIAVWKIHEKIEELPYLQVRMSNVKLYEEVANVWISKRITIAEFLYCIYWKKTQPCYPIRESGFTLSCRQFSSPKWISNRYSRYSWFEWLSHSRFKWKRCWLSP
jgi:hypothetical protein